MKVTISMKPRVARAVAECLNNGITNCYDLLPELTEKEQMQVDRKLRKLQRQIEESLV